MKIPEIGVGLLGLGTVGSGVVRILHDNDRELRRRLGARLKLVRAADINPERAKALGLPDEIATRDAAEVLADPSVQIVVELIGGLDAAKRLILEAFGRGKHVVTANKALLAVHGEELYRAAHETGMSLGFEASVGGGIPILRALTDGLAANRIEAIYGIINGTANYILTKMTEERRPFEDVLEEAKRAGYAEANPSLDVDGIDSAHKLAILACLAFGTPVDVKAIFTEGIRQVTPLDIEYAREFGYRIKLLAIAKRGPSPFPSPRGGEGGERGDASPPEVEARVHPTMVSEDHLIATVRGVYNAIYVVGDAVGDTLFYGRGAGQMPTGSAVVSDLLAIARGILNGSAGRNPVAGFMSEERKPLRIRPMEEIRSLYYLRFMAIDRPGVLSRIAGILGQNRISISSVIQKGRKEGEAVPVVMMTHTALERDVRLALREIDRLPDVAAKTAVIRVEGQA